MIVERNRPATGLMTSALVTYPGANDVARVYPSVQELA
jgi:hypothetical protein